MCFQLKVTHCVRHGRRVSPYLFNVKVDELNEQIKMCNVGCSMNGHRISHVTYADYLVLISASSAGSCQLLQLKNWTYLK